jgi:hypothetical protein
MLATQDAQRASQASPTPTDEPAGGSDKQKQGRRGRPAKSEQRETEFVEWWKPGWRDRIR